MFTSLRIPATACIVAGLGLALSAPAMARHGGEHGRGHDRGGPRVSIQVAPSHYHGQVLGYRHAPRVIHAPRAYYGPRHGYGARFVYSAPIIVGPRVIYSSPVQYVQRIEAPAVVYIERSDPQPQVEAVPAPRAAAGGLWYYCQDSATYYPYVGECASPWQPVPAQPPATLRQLPQ